MTFVTDVNSNSKYVSGSGNNRCAENLSKASGGDEKRVISERVTNSSVMRHPAGNYSW